MARTGSLGFPLETYRGNIAKLGWRKAEPALSEAEWGGVQEGNKKESRKREQACTLPNSGAESCLETVYQCEIKFGSIIPLVSPNGEAKLAFVLTADSNPESRIPHRAS